MKKRELSDAELQTVISLKQKGQSWLRIQNDTGIPRHIAKRSYNQWQSSKSIDQLKEARKEVAVEEFKVHLKVLVSLAQSIIASLRIPTLMETVSFSEINQTWMDNKPKDNWDIPAQLVYKRKERLFQSLQEHMQEKIDWQLLGDWKQARAGLNDRIKMLYNEAMEIMKNILSQREYTDVKTAIEKQLKGEVSIDKLTDGVIELVWRGILTGRPDEIHIFKVTSLINKGRIELSFHPNITGLRIDDLALAKKMLFVCKWALENLRTDKSGTLKSLRDAVSIMRARYDDLEDLLNELVLRPIILQTRCKLCPA